MPERRRPKKVGDDEEKFTIEVISDSSFIMSQTYDGVTFSEYYVKSGVEGK